MSDNVPGFTVLGLHVQDFKGIKVIGLRPKPIGVNRIMGDNHEGKSSLLDSIEVALSGKGALPEQPVRIGADEARIVAEIGAVAEDGVTVVGPVFQVKRVITGKDSELEVREAAVVGASKSLKSVVKPSPKKFLDALAGSRIGFDFFGYFRLDDVKQVQILLDVMQLPQDPRALDRTRDAIFNERTTVNRDAKQAAAVLASMEAVPARTPDEEVPLAELLQEYQRLHAIVQENQRTRRELQDIICGTGEIELNCAAAVDQAAKKVEDLKAQLIDAEAALAETRMEAADTVEKARAQAQQADEALAKIEDPDVAAIQQQMATLEETNKAVRLKQDRAKQSAEVERLDKESEALTQKIGEIDTQKAALFQQAKLPVPGLSIADDGAGGYRVTYNGVPVKQCSSSEQLTIGAEINLALNPKLRIALIREGSLLDDATLDWLDRLCREKRLQALVEIVGEPDGAEEGCFLIRAGELVEAKA